MGQWSAYIRKFIPRANSKDTNFILWECTGFPMIPNDLVRGQIQNLALRIRPHKRGWRRRLRLRGQELWDEMSRLNDEQKE